MAKIQVFLDTDVIISSLISNTGASYEVINHPKIEKIISKTVVKEVNEVSKRLNIADQYTKTTLKKVTTISLGITKNNLKKNYQEYIFDEKDSHVVAGAHRSKSKFLLTHNIKHYKVNSVEIDLGIMVIKPGNFLQYLRSIEAY